MALLADGWHMGTHAAAFCITLFTYHYSKKHAHSDDFSFGTGKVSVLGGFTSAIALSLVSLLMIVESIHRLFSPQQIQFNEAIIVAIVGLIINTICMWLLHDNHHHDANGHHHNHNHNHNHNHHEHEHEHHHDHNLKAAYLHVLADALTSLLAIAALIIGKFLGIIWLDSIMGIVGAIVIINWAVVGKTDQSNFARCQYQRPRKAADKITVNAVGCKSNRSSYLEDKCRSLLCRDRFAE